MDSEDSGWFARFGVEGADGAERPEETIVPELETDGPKAIDPGRGKRFRSPIEGVRRGFDAVTGVRRTFDGERGGGSAVHRSREGSRSGLSRKAGGEGEEGGPRPVGGRHDPGGGVRGRAEGGREGQVNPIHGSRLQSACGNRDKRCARANGNSPEQSVAAENTTSPGNPPQRETRDRWNSCPSTHPKPIRTARRGRCSGRFQSGTPSEWGRRAAGGVLEEGGGIRLARGARGETDQPISPGRFQGKVLGAITVRGRERPSFLGRRSVR